jgi:hypothetical protein
LLASSAALLLLKVNGQFTPPWDTRPLELQLRASPASVPLPEPVTVMLLAHVAVNDTFALVAVVGVTVYFRLPHPVAGVATATDCQVPANSSIFTVLGPVGVSLLLSDFLLSRSHPAARIEAAMSAATTLDFMIFLIVTYDFTL